MTDKAVAWEEARRLQALFTKAGAVAVEADILQPAETLLDLYGEDIRGRAYVTQDALRGEQMLRPDFTVPVVQRHMAHGADPARYTYAGEVFRRQDEDPNRPSEYLQVGYEVFDRANPIAADAEVFSLFWTALAPLQLRAETGDIGFLRSAVEGLQTTDRRKSALLRHLWRPTRFRQLMARFSADAPKRDYAETEAPWIGLRSPQEMADRMAALRQEAETPPISQTESDLLEHLLALKASLPDAVAKLAELKAELPVISEAYDLFRSRVEALDQKGVPVDKIGFAASFGRSAMEYYDGFVFGFFAGDDALPSVATGGRYDALTRVLGGGESIPAVGGVIRPALVSQLREGAA